MSGKTADPAGAAIDAVLADLNPQQREAAGHGAGPLLIVAGAGTGKTTTLAHRVAYLIAEGVDPGRILLLTFTRRAAAEMLRRVDAILARLVQSQGLSPGFKGRLSGRRVCGGTFHAVATRLLQQHGRLIGLEPDFTIVDRSDAEDLLNLDRTQLGLASTEQRFPLKGACLDIYSRCVNTQRPLERLLEESFPWCVQQRDDLKRLFSAYTERKERQRVLDYDDLLLFWHALVTEPAAAEVVRAKFDCVLVDEYQDTNALQAQIVRGLRPDGQGVTVVGDDAQAIYSFRAATVRNILDFPQRFPGTTVVALEQNYRSTQPLLDATNEVIALAAERHRKQLWSARTGGGKPQLVDCQDENEQSDYVVERILSHRETGLELRRQAVLFRASHHSLALEVELARKNIPYHKYGGLKFIETAHVKDLLAFLRLAENPRDVVSAMRVLMLIPAVGHRTAAQLVERLAQRQGDFAAWSDFQPPEAARPHWPLLLALLRLLARRDGKSETMPVQVQQIRRFYAPLLQQKYDQAASRLRDLAQLEQVAARFADRPTFLNEITLDPPSSTQDLADDPRLDEDYLILSTIHSAKGLEWDAVYVLHAADGNIPSDMATKDEDEIEEERRLFYVALTRAKDWLYVLFPQRYYFHARQRSDAHSFAQLTRFLPAELHARFERRPTRAATAASQQSASAGDVTTAEIRRRIGKMWA